MEDRSRLGLGLLGAALILGALGDTLLRGIPWGINAFLWTGALIAAALALARFGRIEAAGEGRWLLPLALLFAAGVVWRDSPFLVFMDLFAILAAASLAVYRSLAGSVRSSGISDYVVGGLYTGVCAAGGPLPAMARDVRWREVVRGREPVLAVARGVLLASPLVLVFGALFVAADAVFEEIVAGIFDFDVEEVAGHAFLVLFWGWVSAGLLWGGLIGLSFEHQSVRRPAGLSLGIVEVGIVLGLLDALFAAFVAVQARYLFGGAEQVLSATGLTYAEYARRGFFELVAVAALVLPVLLLAHWLLRAESRREARLFNAFAGTLLALLLVVMTSAMWRMYLYYDEFGLTQLRFYTTAFMVWVLVVIAWFAVTVMRGRREKFAFGALVSGFAAVVLLNAVNPDAQIARTNLERLDDGKRFDALYLTTLSADAAPVFADALPRIGDKRLFPELVDISSRADRRLERGVPEGRMPALDESVKGPTLGQELKARWRACPDDWRTWNISRARAERLAEQAA